MRVKLLGTLSLMLLVVVGAMVVPKMGAARPSWVVMPARVVIPVVVSFSTVLTRGPYTKLSTSMRSQKRMA